MRLSRATAYALHALAHIARTAGQQPGRLVTSAAVARAQGLPEPFTLKVLKPLVSTALLRSAPGAGGGYRLARPARGITVLQVVEAIDGPVTSSVPDDFAPAKDRLDRRLAAVCREAAELVRGRLGKVRLADLLKG
jgi:Rrf2 family protein